MSSVLFITKKLSFSILDLGTVMLEWLLQRKRKVLGWLLFGLVVIFCCGSLLLESVITVGTLLARPTGADVNFQTSADNLDLSLTFCKTFRGRQHDMSASIVPLKQVKVRRSDESWQVLHNESDSQLPDDAMFARRPFELCKSLPVGGRDIQGCKLMSCRHCQELCQMPPAIDCTGVNNKSGVMISLTQL